MILSDGDTYKYLGQVYDVDRQVDVQTGTIKVEATFPNPDNILRPGLYAKVRAKIGTIHNALLVPQDALFQTQGQAQVAVVGDDNKVTMRNVEVGQTFAGFQLIQKGVSAGEHVVTEGLQKVHDGLLVSPHLVASTPPKRTRQAWDHNLRWLPPRRGGARIMSRFFIRHPTVAIVIAIFFVIAGGVMIFRLPIAQFPESFPRKSRLPPSIPAPMRSPLNNPSPLQSRSRSTAPRT